jgi:hypothetical protein
MVSFFDRGGVLVLDRGRGALVGDHATGAEAHLGGKPELRFQ